MKTNKYLTILVTIFCSFLFSCANSKSDDWKPLFPTDSLEGWNDNQKGKKKYNPNNWSIKDGVLRTSGRPNGILYSDKEYRNFEIEFDWKHHEYGKNSGLFLWIKSTKGILGEGTEIQILDIGYERNYEKKRPKTKGKRKWFTCHGDVFAVGTKLTPFKPAEGSRSFPSEDRTKPHGNWNHYHIRAVDGVVRLSVNGKEVSGGYNIEPKIGPLAWESEGGIVEFKNIMIRELSEDLKETVTEEEKK